MSAFRFNRTRNALIALSIIMAVSLVLFGSAIAVALTIKGETTSNRSLAVVKASELVLKLSFVAILITLGVSGIRFAAMKK